MVHEVDGVVASHQDPKNAGQEDGEVPARQLLGDRQDNCQHTILGNSVHDEYQKMGQFSSIIYEVMFK